MVNKKRYIPSTCRRQYKHKYSKHIKNLRNDLSCSKFKKWPFITRQVINHFEASLCVYTEFVLHIL